MWWLYLQRWSLIRHSSATGRLPYGERDEERDEIIWMNTREGGILWRYIYLPMMTNDVQTTNQSEWESWEHEVWVGSAQARGLRIEDWGSRGLSLDMNHLVKVQGQWQLPKQNKSGFWEFIPEEIVLGRRSTPGKPGPAQVVPWATIRQMVATAPVVHQAHRALASPVHSIRLNIIALALVLFGSESTQPNWGN
jgi:hypothetical protein